MVLTMACSTLPLVAAALHLAQQVRIHQYVSVMMWLRLPAVSDELLLAAPQACCAATAAGLAVLEVLREERLQDAALATGQHLRTSLQRLQACLVNVVL